jgi:hypothetical protein
VSNNQHYLALWLRRRRTHLRIIEAQRTKLRHQRGDLARMHKAIDDLKRRERWIWRLVKAARAQTWETAERNYRLARTNRNLNEENARLQAIQRTEVEPWKGGRYRMAVIAPRHSYPNRTTHISTVGCCAVCGGDGHKLTNHHVFGRTIPLVIRSCVPCHEGFHRELAAGRSSRYVVQMTRAVADAFQESYADKGSIQHVG